MEVLEDGEGVYWLHGLQMWHASVVLQTLSSSCSVREPDWSLRLRLALRLGVALG